MGYSSEFLQGVLSLWVIAALGALILGGADALLGLGVFDGDYPVAWSARGQSAGFGAFALQCCGVLAVAAALSHLVDRFNG